MQFYSFRNLVWVVSFFASTQLHANILSKRYNEVTFVTAHNGQSFLKNQFLSFLPGSNISNQAWSIPEQLEHGVQAMKIPVHPYQGNAYACHGLSPGNREDIKNKLCKKLSILKETCDQILDELNPCMLDPATTKFSNVLRELKIFLENNPERIFTLFIEDKTGNLEQLADLFAESGLEPFIYKQPQNREWPTLKEMIKNNQRLIVFMSRDSDNYGNSLDKYAFFNSKNFFIAESRYNFRSILSLEKDRYGTEDEKLFSKIIERDPDNKLWVLQHFVTPTLGGAADSSKVVNAWPFLQRRISEYQSHLGKPNFVWLDFLTDVDVANINQLNEM